MPIFDIFKKSKGKVEKKPLKKKEEKVEKKSVEKKIPAKIPAKKKTGKRSDKKSVLEQKRISRTAYSRKGNHFNGKRSIYF